MPKRSNAIVWIGTERGAVRLNRTTAAVSTSAGLRWLPHDRVTGIGIDGASVWIETPQGYSRVQYAPMTLADKSRAFVERVQARHNRWGLTADSHLRVAGDLSSNQLDLDGQRRSLDGDVCRGRVVSFQGHRRRGRCAATPAPGMQAIMRLESITGIPGFPARSFIKVGVDEQPADGEWHDAKDGWRWKGDTSSDEIVGPLLRLSDLLRPRRRRRGAARLSARRSAASPITSSSTTISSSTSTGSGRGGDGGRLTSSGTTRTRRDCERFTSLRTCESRFTWRAIPHHARAIRRRTTRSSAHTAITC